MLKILIMVDDLLLKLGYKIKFERTKRNLSQEQLAELTSLSSRTISAIERGMGNVTFKNLYVIAQVLELSLGDFSEFKL